jgi:hypothetical protein
MEINGNVHKIVTKCSQIPEDFSPYVRKYVRHLVIIVNKYVILAIKFTQITKNGNF